MMEKRTLHRFSQTARKWRDLVDRRCAHFVELHSSGRWKHYYDEAEFVLRMREALDLAETWSQIAPMLNEHTTPAPAEPGPNQVRRKAACSRVLRLSKDEPWSSAQPDEGVRAQPLETTLLTA